jgi:hypothetical protein
MKLLHVCSCWFVFIVKAKSLMELELIQTTIIPNLQTYNLIVF